MDNGYCKYHQSGKFLSRDMTPSSEHIIATPIEASLQVPREDKEVSVALELHGRISKIHELIQALEREKKQIELLVPTK